jgi:hypothetical protein
VASIVDVCNVALGAVGAPLINSIDDANTGARLCKANFALIRDAVLEERPWSFALKRKSYTREVAPPAFGYSYQYAFGSEVLRVFEAFVTDPGDLAYTVEDRRILCDEADGINARVIVRVEDLSLWSPSFTAAVAFRLGALLAVPLVDNRTLQADQWQLYAKQLSLAGTLDGMQQRSVQRTGPSSLKNARY